MSDGSKAPTKGEHRTTTGTSNTGPGMGSKNAASKSTASKGTASKGDAGNRSQTAAKRSRSSSSTARTSKAGQKSTASAAAKKAGPAAKPGPRTATVNLPFVTAQFRAPQLHAPSLPVPRPPVPSVHLPSLPVPGRRELSDATRVAGSWMPPRDQMALYTGLGVGAVVGLIDWPVAFAVAAGTAVAKRARSSRSARAASR